MLRALMLRTLPYACNTKRLLGRTDRGALANKASNWT
jgi:hypothetical protein